MSQFSILGQFSSCPFSRCHSFLFASMIHAPAFAPKINGCVFVKCREPGTRSRANRVDPFEHKKPTANLKDTGLVILLDVSQNVSQNAPGEVEVDSKYYTPAN